MKKIALVYYGYQKELIFGDEPVEHMIPERISEWFEVTDEECEAVKRYSIWFMVIEQIPEQEAKDVVRQALEVAKVRGKRK